MWIPQKHEKSNLNVYETSQKKNNVMMLKKLKPIYYQYINTRTIVYNIMIDYTYTVYAISITII